MERFLPITRTPKGLFKETPVEKLDQLIYGEQLNTIVIANNHTRATKTEQKRNRPETEVSKAPSPIAPLQRQV